MCVYIYIYIYIHTYFCLATCTRQNAETQELRTITIMIATHARTSASEEMIPVREREWCKSPHSPSHRRGTLKGVPTVKSPTHHF